jgi:hypothetical protein
MSTKWTFFRASVAGLVCVLVSAPPVRAVESKLWQQFVQARRNGMEPILPDFSYAGYHGGVDAIPDVKGPVFDVKKFGAKGDGEADDQDAIQRTIDVAENAGGGVVFFPAGTYRVNMDFARRRPIVVRSGHIVLRGSGATRGGTVLLIDEPTLKTKKAADELLGDDASTKDEKGDDAGGESGEGTAAAMVQIQPKDQGHAEHLANVNGDSPRESFVLFVDDSSKIKPGMWVSLTVKSKAVVPDMIAPYHLDDLPKEWTRIHSTIGLVEHHLVTAIQGNRVKLREPIKTVVKAEHGWSLNSYPNIAEVGVEDICFEGGWLGKFVHHRSWMDDDGWAALKIFTVTDSWIRRCAFINLNNCVGAESCAYTSILQNVLAGTMGHVSTDAHRRSTGMLYGLMVDRLEQQPQMRDTTHGIGAAGSAVGTVFWRYTMQPEESFDMHGNFPYATLFDCVTGGNLGGSGGPVPSFPNHLHHFVAWNFYQTRLPARGGDKPYDFWGGRPSLVAPILVGLHGEIPKVEERTVGINEAPGQMVGPQSLYEAQLALRFGGRTPAWVDQAKQAWERMQKNLPSFPRGGDNTPWVAKKREQIIRLIMDTPMRKDHYDPKDPEGALLKQWPTSDGRSWVAPGDSQSPTNR